MSIKGTRTEKNLWNAFSGESQARNKYMFFAEKAELESHIQIADVFRQTAIEEENHAKTIFNFLNGIEGTKSNLLSSIRNENYEWTTMYEDYKRVALEEGFTEIADFFEEVIKIEKIHEERYFKLVKDIL